MARRQQSVTYREGTSKKYWYTIAGYLAVGVLGLLYVIFTWQSASGGSGAKMAGMAGGIVLLLFSGGGLVIYPALFKDSAYLRESGSRWSPKWWYYILGGFGTPLATYFALNFGMKSMLAFTGAFLIHAVSATIVAGLYLYRRHKYVGVP